MAMIKVAINKDYGSFNLSEEFAEKYGCSRYEYEYAGNEEGKLHRMDKGFVQALEEFGLEEASGYGAYIQIVEVDDSRSWSIQEEDGMEWIVYED